MTVYIVPDKNCKECFGEGIVYDIVDYGSTKARIPTNCSCVDEQIPEGREDEEIKIVEVLPPDQQLRRAGMPTLPGLE